MSNGTFLRNDDVNENDYPVTTDDCRLLALPVRMGGLGLAKPTQLSSIEYEASVTVTKALVTRIVTQDHLPPDAADTRSAKLHEAKKIELLKETQELVKNSLTSRSMRAVGLASEKGASSWLTVIPMKDLGYNLSKREFRDAIKIRYGWEISDLPKTCVCGDFFDVDHAMICRRGGFVIQRHNELRDLEKTCVCGDFFDVDHAMICRRGGFVIQRHKKLRDLEADLLRIVSSDVEVESILQQMTGESLNRGANRTPDARLDRHARGFWERQRSAFFDVLVCRPNAESYREKTPEQVYRQYESEKKRQYANRVMEVEQGTFTPLIFSTTGGMGTECKIYHKRLAELVSDKEGESYASTMSWTRAKVSFALIRLALLCLRGSRTIRRTLDIIDLDFSLDNTSAPVQLSFVNFAKFYI
ncbi:hypothetical protein AWC38_SpisGene17749 [Stylophora pistillata]|uniref:Uncharacterized protein n=1 Tax=Stylophora pistillata TaxID=50429 RepID=A0A2B4RM69_STYPI|nr:hypothetical protein AWC38_SpisGene17749 [Stylophora pistillata]